MKALFDTNILVEYLNAVTEARLELQRYAEKAISIVTWMEGMVGADGDLELPHARLSRRLRSHRCR